MPFDPWPKLNRALTIGIQQPKDVIREHPGLSGGEQTTNLAIEAPRWQLAQRQHEVRELIVGAIDRQSIARVCLNYVLNLEIDPSREILILSKAGASPVGR